MSLSSRYFLLSFFAVLATPGLVEARSIGVRKACFNFGEAIEIDFDNTGLPGPRPDFDDWIGLSNPNTLDIASLDPRPFMWMWACGDQFCADAVSGGTVVFGPNQPDESGVDSWPLDAGEYVAFLTGGVNPYQARALSINFKVMPEGHFCPGTQPQQQDVPIKTENNSSPTPSPTEVPTLTPMRALTRAPIRTPTPAPMQKRTPVPTRPPVPAPTPPPTQKHTPAPTPTPTRAPIAVPTLEPTEPVPIVVPDKVVVSEHSGISRIVRNARNDIQRIIASERRLAPKFLRLVFHDCVGGCDGTYHCHVVND